MYKECTRRLIPTLFCGRPLETITSILRHVLDIPQPIHCTRHSGSCIKLRIMAAVMVPVYTGTSMASTGMAWYITLGKAGMYVAFRKRRRSGHGWRSGPGPDRTGPRSWTWTRARRYYIITLPYVPMPRFRPSLHATAGSCRTRRREEWRRACHASVPQLHNYVPD